MAVPPPPITEAHDSKSALLCKYEYEYMRTTTLLVAGQRTVYYYTHVAYESKYKYSGGHTNK